MRTTPSLLSLLSLAGLLLSGCAQLDTETCRGIAAAYTSEAQLRKTPAGTDGCYWETNKVPVFVGVSWGIKGWSVEKVWVDGETVSAASEIRPSVEKASRLDDAQCRRQFLREGKSVRSSATPGGEHGCSGSVNDVSVDVKIVRELDGWKTTRSWVEGREVPIRELSSIVAQEARRKAEEAQRVAEAQAAARRAEETRKTAEQVGHDVKKTVEGFFQGLFKK